MLQYASTSPNVISKQRFVTSSFPYSCLQIKKTKHSTLRAGTNSYIDPEYLDTGKLKRESDVYSFGVVLFEILCGRLANDPIYQKKNDKGLAHVARQSFNMGTLEDMIDPIIKEEANHVLTRGPNKDSLHTFIEIARKCIAETQDQRPTMKVVVKELEKALFFHKNNKDNPILSIEDINLATRNFHKDNCIGGGGFGRVFRGTLQDGDNFKTIVAKRLDTKLGQGEQQFLSELQILSEYKHENVVNLVAYCDQKDEKIIVYEYAPRGSLDRYLNNVSLTWVKRLNICIDVASALYFLHGGIEKQAKVIHRDIKTANILLEKDWKAKLADFGLSLISPINQETDYVIDHVCGTLGYVDPIYNESGFLTIESDIYSFGIVLFEILCGRSTFAIQKQEGHYLPEFVENKFEEGKHDEMVFKQIREEIVPKSLTTFQEIAYQCLHQKRQKQPTTKKVLTQLKKALEFQNMASTIAKLAHLQLPHEDILDEVCLCKLTGTMGYMDPKIAKTGGVTYMSDICSFGVVLLEILFGRKAYIENEANEFLVPFAIRHCENGTLTDMIYPPIIDQMCSKSYFRFPYFAYSCLNEEQNRRPNAEKIVSTFEEILESQLQYDNFLTNGWNASI
ncbi:hypothetical protein QVD17_08092 [Tagetes erecta]|uniref:Protein kinase domain-containing protein n=1 Tax=Tagetes erecta TaxID=13708 RepID=A0AAD8P326_TARER|nr:hypothetical protein QVD17_08092 [Tagetes erecta]